MSDLKQEIPSMNGGNKHQETGIILEMANKFILQCLQYDEEIAKLKLQIAELLEVIDGYKEMIRGLK